jgi:hypothetical protein
MSHRQCHTPPSRCACPPWTAPTFRPTASPYVHCGQDPSGTRSRSSTVDIAPRRGSRPSRGPGALPAFSVHTGYPATGGGARRIAACQARPPSRRGSNGFLRDREIYSDAREDDSLTIAECREPASSDRLPVHRSESPTGYSSTGCSPAEPASASPVTDNSSSMRIQRGNQMRCSTSLQGCSPILGWRLA